MKNRTELALSMFAVVAFLGAMTAGAWSLSYRAADAFPDQYRFNVNVARAAVSVADDHDSQSRPGTPSESDGDTNPRAAGATPAPVDRTPAAAFATALDVLGERVAYSTTPARRRWTYTVSGRLDDPTDLRRLLNGGSNVGKFDPAWLQQLTRAELIALHSDSRENAVQWDCVKRPADAHSQKPIRIRETAMEPKRGRWITIQQCGPGGRCTSRRVWVEE